VKKEGTCSVNNPNRERLANSDSDHTSRSMGLVRILKFSKNTIKKKRNLHTNKKKIKALVLTKDDKQSIKDLIKVSETTRIVTISPVATAIKLSSDQTTEFGNDGGFTSDATWNAAADIGFRPNFGDTAVGGGT